VQLPQSIVNAVYKQGKSFVESGDRTVDFGEGSKFGFFQLSLAVWKLLEKALCALRNRLFEPYEGLQTARVVLGVERDCAFVRVGDHACAVGAALFPHFSVEEKSGH